MTRAATYSFESWVTKNPILEDGEFGRELETGKVKMGNGTSRWNDLPYFGHQSRAELEETLYDKAYSWELVPGSDIPATCVGVLPKVADGDPTLYAGLVTVDHAITHAEANPGEGDHWFLLAADTPITRDGYDNGTYATEGAPAGAYVAFYDDPDSPPYAFPDGWTPGNTTGSGPVLPYLGHDGPGAPDGAEVFAGLVFVEEGSAGTGSDFWLAAASTPLTISDVNGADPIRMTSDPTPVPSGVYLGIWNPPGGSLDMPAFPDGWTFHPYGIGQVAITDENAGGLIGDVAYVVSGFVYNPPQAAGASVQNYRGLTQPGSTSVQAGESYAYFPNTLITVLTDGTLVATGVGQAPTGDSTATFDSGISGPQYWPFIERFDLAAGEWLPRIPLPPVGPTTPSTWTDEGGDYVAMYDVKAGDVISIPPGALLGTPHDIHVSPFGSGMFPDDIVTPAFFAVSSGNVLGPVTVGADGQIALYDYGPYDGSGTDVPGATSGYAPFAVTPPAASSFITPGPGWTNIFAAEGGIAGVIDGKLYFGGGDGDNVTGREFFVYDPADESITRLADMDTAAGYADYNPYGVVGGKLIWIGGTDNYANVYDPATDTWTSTLHTGTQVGGFGDQVQGFEIDGKLWFVYQGAVAVFDLDALVLTAKTSCSDDIDQTYYLIDNKIHAYGGTGTPAHLHWIYDPTTDVWSSYDNLTNAAPNSNYGGAECTQVVYQSVPYAFSGIVDRNFDGRPELGAAAGVYGLTGVALDKPRPARLQDKAEHAPDTDWVTITNPAGAADSHLRYRRIRGVVLIEGYMAHGGSYPFASTIPTEFLPKTDANLIGVGAAVTITTAGVLAVNGTTPTYFAGQYPLF